MYTHTHTHTLCGAPLFRSVQVRTDSKRLDDTQFAEQGKTEHFHGYFANNFNDFASGPATEFREPGSLMFVSALFVWLEAGSRTNKKRLP